MYPVAIDTQLAQPYADDRANELDAKVRLILAPIPESAWRMADRSRVPDTWAAALAAGDVNVALSALGWCDVETIVPRTVELLRDRLAGLGLVLTQSEPPSLLYFFLLEDDLMVFEGFLPATGSARNGGAPRPDEVARMQAVHDGWFEYFSGDVGWSPEEEWQIIGSRRSDGQTLTGIASKGSGLAGFEPGEPGLPARVLWPDDGRVDEPARVFETIDEWIAAALEEAQTQR